MTLPCVFLGQKIGDVERQEPNLGYQMPQKSSESLAEELPSVGRLWILHADLRSCGEGQGNHHMSRAPVLWLLGFFLPYSILLLSDSAVREKMEVAIDCWSSFPEL